MSRVYEPLKPNGFSLGYLMETEVGIEPTLLRFCRPHPIPISRTRPSEDGACVAGIYSAAAYGS